MADEVELFGFYYAHNTACIVCVHVADGAPLAFAVHDSEGDLAFACERAEHADEEWKVIGLGRAALMIDLTAVPHLDEGQAARRRAGGEWAIGPAN